MPNQVPRSIVGHLKLRRALPEDAAILARIHVDSWQGAYRGIVPDGTLKEFTYIKREKAFRESLVANAEETYLVERDDAAIGILTIGVSRDPDLDRELTGEIWGIYLVPENWRRGFGTMLVIEAERALAARGYAEVVLWVLEANRAARTFYEAVGYVADGQVRTVELGKPLLAVRYKKALGQPMPP